MLANPDTRRVKRRRWISEPSLSPDHDEDAGDNDDDDDFDSDDDEDDDDDNENNDDDDNDDDDDDAGHMEAKADAGLLAASLSSTGSVLT